MSNKCTNKSCPDTQCFWRLAEADTKVALLKELVAALRNGQEVVNLELPKPCPFCGGAGVLFHGGRDDPEVIIQCSRCGAARKQEFTTATEAVADWNARIKEYATNAPAKESPHACI